METQSKNIFVNELKFKDSLESIFIVKYIALMEGRDGRSYLNIVLADATGEIESRFWGPRAQEISEYIKKGQYVKVKGKVNQYQGRKQVILQDVDSVSKDEVDEKDFIAKSKNSADEMYARLLEIVCKLDDVYIRDLLKSILEDAEIKRRLHLWPAGKSIHHAYQAGLLEHILSCAELSVNLSPIYHANLNYVLAGAVLHDLAKIYELSDGLVVEYTEEGKLVGHLAKGLELVDRYAYRIKNFPYMTKMHLKHIVLSHHGAYEYGSPKIPQTSEAMLVHLIDYLDSKMNSLEQIKRSDTTPGHWTAFNKPLDRILFKGELPFYPEYISVQEDLNEHEEKPQLLPRLNLGSRPSYTTSGPKELKESLGKHLQNLKLDIKK